jgi:hypothetical protein
VAPSNRKEKVPAVHPISETPAESSRRATASTVYGTLDDSVGALTSMVMSLIANDPDHNQFVDVSYFAQTPGGQRRK